MRVRIGDGKEEKVDKIEGVAGDLAQAVVIMADKTEIEIVGDLIAQLGAGGDIVVKIVIAALARRQQVQRRDRRGAGKEMLHRRLIVEIALGAGKRRALVEGVETAAFDIGGDRHRAFAAFGDDIDHAADGVGAVERALRSAQHFHLGDIAGQQFGDVDRAAGGRGIGDVDAVQQHLGMVGDWCRAGTARFARPRRRSARYSRPARNAAHRAGSAAGALR